MSGHTPGPWAVGEDGDVIWGARWKGAITHVAIVPFSKDPRVSADARLIAAAPELLEACEMAVQTFIVSCRPAGNPDVDDAAEIRGMVATLRAAIAKATGASA